MSSEKTIYSSYPRYSIKDIGLPKVISNALLRADINYLDELINNTYVTPHGTLRIEYEDQFKGPCASSCKNIGPGRLVILHKTLEKLGLEVRGLSKFVNSYKSYKSYKSCSFCDLDDVTDSLVKSNLTIKGGMTDLSLLDFEVFINSEGEIELYGDNCNGDPMFRSVQKINYCPMCGRKL
jgi:hypothetical protein